MPFISLPFPIPPPNPPTTKCPHPIHLLHIPHLAVVSLQVAHIVKRVCRVQLNDCPMNSRKQVATIAKSALEQKKKHKLTKQEKAPSITPTTSRHPRIVNSLNGRMSSMRRFISRSLSLKPTRMNSPDGWRATLYASSVKSLRSSSELKTSRNYEMECYGWDMCHYLVS